jgi:tetratricopeptide (TPR) repeat protein
MDEHKPTQASGLPLLSQIVGFEAAANSDNAAADGLHPYYAGIIKAKRGCWDEAEGLLMDAWVNRTDAGPQMEKASAAALADLYRCKAEEMIARQEFSAAAHLLREAQSLDPDNARAKALMRKLAFVLPACHVLEGKRDLAEQTWTKTFEKNRSDTRIAHCLAVLYYFWASEHLENGRTEEAADAWMRASEYWSLILCSPDFRKRWGEERSAVHGSTAQPDEIEGACRTATDTLLRTVLTAADVYRDKGDEAASRTLLRAYGVVLGEIRGAELLCQAAALMGGRAPKGTPVGGPRALKRCGGWEQAQKVAKGAADAGMDPESSAKLSVAYSGRAPEWGLIEAKLFELAISVLKKMPKRSPEQNELLARAYFEQGMAARDDNGNDRALECWIEAAKALGSRDVPLRREIEKKVISAAKPVFEDTEKSGLPAVRKTVERLRVVARHLGSERIKSNLSSALVELALAEHLRGDKGRIKPLLEEAHTINPQNQRATRQLAAAIGNEAGEAMGRKDPETAERLMRKARELDPVDSDHRKFHSLILSNWAVDLVNKAAGRDRYAVLAACRAAIEKIKEALEIDPGNDHARTNGAEIIEIMRRLGF